MLHADKIEKFMLAPNKPKWCKPREVAIIVYLMILADKEGHCSPKQEDIAAAIGSGDVNLFGIREGIKRLKDNSWLTVDKKITTLPYRYRIKFENLPGKEEIEQTAP